MFAIQPLILGSAVCILCEVIAPFVFGSAFAMEKMPGPTCILQNVTLITKFLTTDGLAASAIMVCEVIILARKPWNSVKAGTFITTFFSPGAQSMKVF